MAPAPLKLGILGFGIFAEKRLIPGAAGAPSVEIVAIQKRSLAQARAKAANYGIPHFHDSADALLANPEVEAVFVASPNHLHAPQTVAAAAAGKHVICEKPMALAPPECVAMIRACEHAGVHLMVAHCQRFAPTVRALKEVVAREEFGAVKFATVRYSFHTAGNPRQWYFDKAIAGGGASFDIGVHCIDDLRFVLETELTRVYSQVVPETTDLRRDVDETMQVSCRFASGAVGSAAVSLQAAFNTYFEVVGEHAVVHAALFNLINRDVPVTYRVGHDVRDFVVHNDDHYTTELEAFAAAVRGEHPVPVPGVEGLQNQLILAACQQATSGPVPVPPAREYLAEQPG